MLDFALTDLHLQDVGAEWKYIWEEEILVISQEEGPFWDRTEVSFSELKDMPIKCEAVGDPIRDRIDACCRKVGVTPYVALESTIASSIGVVDPFTARMVSFMPAHRFMQILQHRPEARDKLRAARLVDPECTQVMGIARRAERGMTADAAHFFQFVWDYFSNLDREVKDFMREYFSER